LLDRTYLVGGRPDLDPPRVLETSREPGKFVTVHDPRVAAEVWALPSPGLVVPLSELLVPWKPPASPAIVEGKRQASAPDPSSPALSVWWSPPYPAAEQLASLSPDQLRRELVGDRWARSALPLSAEDSQARSTAIRRRAGAALRLAQLGEASPAVVHRLLWQVRHRTLHPDYTVHGMDGAVAVRALAGLRAVEAVPALIEEFKRINPDLQKLGTTPSGQPWTWWDRQIEMRIMQALGYMPTPEAKEFLRSYAELTFEEAQEMGHPMWDDFYWALVRQDWSQAEIEDLLRSDRGDISGNMLEYCLDNPSPERTAAVRAVRPEALAWPGCGRTGRESLLPGPPDLDPSGDSRRPSTPGPVLAAEEARWAGYTGLTPAKRALRLTDTVAGFVVEDADVPSVLRKLNNEYGLRYGLEVIPENTSADPYALLSLTVEQATVEEILDRLVALNPDFAWSTDDETVNFFLRDARARPDYPLHAVIPEFVVQDEPYALALFTRIMTLVEETDLLLATSFRHPVEVGPRVTLALENCDLRQILNAIARQAEMSWEVSSFEPGKAGMVMGRKLPVFSPSAGGRHRREGGRILVR
jgi:hypothetical protein